LIISHRVLHIHGMAVDRLIRMETELHPDGMHTAMETAELPHGGQNHTPVDISKSNKAGNNRNFC
jgi:hypothetical protein